jgi:hypothetical protein
MENGQPTKTASASENPADISDVSAQSVNSETMPLGELKNSSVITTATTQIVTPKTWKSAELLELESKAGLVAGALADFQAAGGLIHTKPFELNYPSGSKFTGVKIMLFVNHVNLVAKKTADGLVFRLVAETKEDTK